MNEQTCSNTQSSGSSGKKGVPNLELPQLTSSGGNLRINRPPPIELRPSPNSDGSRTQYPCCPKASSGCSFSYGQIPSPINLSPEIGNIPRASSGSPVFFPHFNRPNTGSSSQSISQVQNYTPLNIPQCETCTKCNGRIVVGPPAQPGITRFQSFIPPQQYQQIRVNGAYCPHGNNIRLPELVLLKVHIHRSWNNYRRHLSGSAHRFINRFK